MARPLKSGMDYFPHDTDATSDEKIEILRALYGNDGYAFYFILLERIYRTATFELDVSDAETRQILAKKVEVSMDKFDEMLATGIKRKCFCPKCYKERGVLTSPGIKQRASTVVNKRLKMANSYQQRQVSTSIPANEGVSDAETTPETPLSDELPSREKESKEKESNNTIPVSTETGVGVDIVKPQRTGRKADKYSPEFEAFWKLYRKPSGSKKAAYTEWKNLEPEHKELVFSAIPQYINFQPNSTFRKDADRFLKAKMWESDFDVRPSPPITSQIPLSVPSTRKVFRELP